MLLAEIRARGPGYKEGPHMQAYRAKATAMYQKTLQQVRAVREPATCRAHHAG